MTQPQTILDRYVTLREHFAHDTKAALLPVKADVVIPLGAPVAAETASDGLLVPLTDAAGLVFVGIALDPLDNTGAADGTFTVPATTRQQPSWQRCIRVDRAGVWRFDLDGDAPLPGETAYFLDADTLTKDSGALTGAIVAGEFVRPAAAGAWWVDITRR